MKKILLILASILLICSCKDDDDKGGSNNEENTMSYLGKEFDLSEVDIELTGDDLIIYANSLTEEDGGVSILFYDMTVEDLNGTFTQNSNDETYQPHENFYNAIVGNSDESSVVSDGSVTITTDGSHINFSFDFDAYGDPATGHFKGVYTLID